MLETKTVDSLMQLVNSAYTSRIRLDPAQTDRWLERRDALLRRLHGLRRPTAQRPAAHAVAEVAQALAAELRDVLAEMQSLKERQPKKRARRMNMGTARRVAQARLYIERDDALKTVACGLAGVSFNTYNRWCDDPEVLQELAVLRRTGADD